jgi:hypothetical protein
MSARARSATTGTNLPIQRANTVVKMTHSPSASQEEAKPATFHFTDDSYRGTPNGKLKLKLRGSIADSSEEDKSDVPVRSAPSSAGKALVIRSGNVSYCLKSAHEELSNHSQRSSRPAPSLTTRFTSDPSSGNGSNPPSLGATGTFGSRRITFSSREPTSPSSSANQSTVTSFQTAFSSQEKEPATMERAFIALDQENFTLYTNKTKSRELRNFPSACITFIQFNIEKRLIVLRISGKWKEYIASTENMDCLLQFERESDVKPWVLGFLEAMDGFEHPSSNEQISSFSRFQGKLSRHFYRCVRADLPAASSQSEAYLAVDKQIKQLCGGMALTTLLEKLIRIALDSRVIEEPHQKIRSLISRFEEKAVSNKELAEEKEMKSLKNALFAESFLSCLNHVFSIGDSMLHALALSLFWVLNVQKSKSLDEQISDFNDFLLAHFEDGTVGAPVKNLLLYWMTQEVDFTNIAMTVAKLNDFNLGLNQPIVCVELWKPMMTLLRLCRIDVAESFLTDLNSMLIKSSSNCLKVAEIPGWQVELLKFLPYSDTSASLSYNLLAIVHYYEFITPSNFLPSFLKTFEMINRLCISNPDQFSIFQGQKFLMTMVSKLKNSVVSFGGDFASPTYEHLRELIDLILSFCFCMLKFGTLGYNVHESVETPKDFGVHIDNGRVNDFELVVTTLDLLKKLRISEFDKNTMPNLSKADRNSLSELGKRIVLLQNACAFMLILQFKCTQITPGSLSELAKKFWEAKSLSKRLSGAIAPLLGYATQPWVRGITTKEFDDIITSHLVKGVDSLLDFLEINLELKTASKKGIVKPNCFLGSDLINLLMKQKLVGSEKEALLVANVLLSSGIFENMENDDSSPFRNKRILYTFSRELRFRRRSHPFSAQKSMSFKDVVATTIGRSQTLVDMADFKDLDELSATASEQRSPMSVTLPVPPAKKPKMNLVRTMTEVFSHSNNEEHAKKLEHSLSQSATPVAAAAARNSMSAAAQTTSSFWKNPNLNKTIAIHKKPAEQWEEEFKTYDEYQENSRIRSSSVL